MRGWISPQGRIRGTHWNILDVGGWVVFLLMVGWLLDAYWRIQSHPYSQTFVATASRAPSELSVRLKVWEGRLEMAEAHLRHAEFLDVQDTLTVIPSRPVRPSSRLWWPLPPPP